MDYLIVPIDFQSSGCIEQGRFQEFHSFLRWHCWPTILGSELIHFQAKAAKALQTHTNANPINNNESEHYGGYPTSISSWVKLGHLPSRSL